MASSTMPPQMAMKMAARGQHAAVAGASSRRWLSACSTMPAASSARLQHAQQVQRQLARRVPQRVGLGLARLACRCSGVPSFADAVDFATQEGDHAA